MLNRPVTILGKKLVLNLRLTLCVLKTLLLIVFVFEVSGQEPRWTFNFELPLLTLMSRFSTVLLLIIFTEILPKESATSLKQQNQDLKDKVDALLKEIGNLRTTTTALSTTTGSELQCTAQARLVNFVVVVSSTTPNKVESRRPAIHKHRQV